MESSDTGGATYYVDRRRGAEAHFTSLQAALEADLRPGDRVVVRAGVYHERVVVRVSGAPGRPITIEGERGAQGEWLTVLDGSEPISREGWETAPEFAPNHGVFRRPWSDGKPFCLVIEEEGETYGIPEFGHVGDKFDAFLYLNLPEDQLAWGGERWDEGGVLPEAAGLCGQPVKYWDGIEAGYHYRDGFLYLRFRHGDDPRDKLLRWSPGKECTGSPNESIGAGFLLADRTFVIIRNLHLRGCQVGVMIQGGEAHHNVVDSCLLANGHRKVVIEDRASHNRVENCVLTSRNVNPNGYSWGPWGGGWAYRHGVSSNLYYRFKQEVGVMTSSLRQSSGVRLSDFGPGNVVAHNEAHNLCAPLEVSEWGGPNLRVFGNHFHDVDICIVCWATPDYAVNPSRPDVQYGMRDLQIYDNRFDSFFMAVRPQGEGGEHRHKREVYFYRNLLWTEPGVEGRAWFVWLEGGSAEPPGPGPHEYYLYHNSYSGGKEVVTWRAENARFINNIFSCSLGLVLKPQFLPMLHDHNWCGGNAAAPEAGHSGSSGVVWKTVNQPPHDHNRIHAGEWYWPDAQRPDFRLVAAGPQRDAVGTALDLSAIPVTGKLLPGFPDRVPDMGAVPFGEEPPPTGPLGVLLDRAGWTAIASHHAENASVVLDGDFTTRWSTEGPAAKGSWLQVDMQAICNFDHLALESLGSRYEFPPSYAIYLSDDGLGWGRPAAEGKGADTVTVVRLPGSSARYIRVVQTSPTARRPWSIHEFRVYRREASSGLSG